MTLAPARSAFAGESSFDPLSTTMVSVTRSVCARMSSRTCSSRPAPFQFGMTAVTCMRSGEPLLHEKPKIMDAVPPGVELHLAETRRILDRDLGKSHLRILQRLDFDLFRKCHAVG